MPNFIDKYIIKKYISIKQTRCLKALEYVNKERLVYSTAMSLINAHERYMDMDDLISPLSVIKRFYKKDLECKIEYMKKHGEVDNELFINSLDYDKRILEILNDKYMLKFSEIKNCIKYIEANKKYLTDEQQKTYLPAYYSLMGNNIELDKIRIRTVK